jgi:hypothetical protein
MYSNFFEANEAAKSARSLASELRGARERWMSGGISTLPPGLRCEKPTPVYIFREFETLSALPFYLDSCVGIADPRSGDLHNGHLLDPQPERFADIPAMASRAAAEPLWLVVPNGQRKNFARDPISVMFVEVRSVGPNELYASRALARRRDDSLSVHAAAAPPQRITLR